MNKSQGFIEAFRNMFPDNIRTAQDFYEKLAKLTNDEFQAVLQKGRYFWLCANEDAVCPLCHERFYNREAHGSWCK